MLDTNNQFMKCLIIRATSTACLTEIEAVRAALKTHRVDSREVEWISRDDFLSQISKTPGEKFHLVYVAAHADMNGFGESGGYSLHDWDDLSSAICETSCMLPGATLFLGCCRGGMKTVALTMLKGCDQIDYICGPIWNTKGTRLIQAFNSFVECKFAENLEPNAIRERMTSAAGQNFSCYDRQELEAEVAMMRQIGQMKFQLDYLVQGQHALAEAIDSLNKKLSCAVSDPEFDPSKFELEQRITLPPP
jgi:hypothetical protein